MFILKLDLILDSILSVLDEKQITLLRIEWTWDRLIIYENNVLIEEYSLGVKYN